MTKAASYRWEVDELAHGARTTTVRTIDPYSYWLLIAGRDFDLTTLEPIEDPADFGYVAAVDAFDLDNYIEQEWGFFRLLKVEGSPLDQDDVISLIRADLASHRDRPPFYYPLPLRHRSIRQVTSTATVPDDRDVLPTEDGWTPPAGLDPDRIVVVACIDDAINFAHHRFRSGSAGSRVDFAWVQDGDAKLDGPLPFGREWTRPEIEAALDAAGGDEDDLLRRLGLVDFSRFGLNPLARRASHGTHVLDIAAGAEPDDPDAVNRRLITVALPALVTLETSGAHLSHFFISALQYILIRTREISNALGPDVTVPLVVNFSYGIAGGPHDGGHYIEQVIERLIDHHRGKGNGGPVAVCLPAGNGNLARGHASTRRGEQERTELTLPWRVQPGDRTSSYLEIWLPRAARGPRIRVEGPWATMATERPEAADIDLKEGEPHLLLRTSAAGTAEADTVIARLTLDRPGRQLPNGQGEGVRGDLQRILLALAPTEPEAPHRDAAPPGLWEVTVSAVLPRGGRIDAWIQRDDTPLTYRGAGRQSYFDEAAYRRFTEIGDAEAHDDPDDASVVRRQGTLNGIATGPSPLVIAGYQADDAAMRPAAYSATSARGMKVPVAAAASDRSRALPGVLAAGARSGSRLPVNGTSVAVPQATRMIADHFAAGPTEGLEPVAEMLRTRAEDHEAAIEIVAEPASSNRAGAGRLAVHEALAAGMKR